MERFSFINDVGSIGCFKVTISYGSSNTSSGYHSICEILKEASCFIPSHKTHGMSLCDVTFHSECKVSKLIKFGLSINLSEEWYYSQWAEVSCGLLGKRLAKVLLTSSLTFEPLFTFLSSRNSYFFGCQVTYTNFQLEYCIKDE